jgi:FkbM family methyltransferase
MLKKIKAVIPYKLRVFIRKLIQPIEDKNTTKDITALYQPIINTNDLVFDIGGWRGSFTKAFRNLGARVIVIEPQPILNKFLRKKFKDDNNVTILWNGVDEKKGELPMFINPTDTCSASFLEEWRKKRNYQDTSVSKKIMVPIITLEELIKRFGRPKVIKLDVEGFEYRAIKGLKTEVPFIAFEITTACRREIPLILKKLSMRDKHLKLNLTFSQNESKGFIFANWKRPEEILNYLKNRETIDGDIYVKMSSFQES